MNGGDRPDAGRGAGFLGDRLQHLPHHAGHQRRARHSSQARHPPRHQLESHMPRELLIVPADPAAGAPGQAGVATLSSAMHSSHASRMGPAATLASECYACHPGIARTASVICTWSGMQRVVPRRMSDVGNPARGRPGCQPRGADCHQTRRPTFEFEPLACSSGRDRARRRQCVTCHSSPHAMTPAATATDNLQSIDSGHAGVINTCDVPHPRRPATRSAPRRRRPPPPHFLHSPLLSVALPRSRMPFRSAGSAGAPHAPSNELPCSALSVRCSAHCCRAAARCPDVSHVRDRPRRHREQRHGRGVERAGSASLRATRARASLVRRFRRHAHDRRSPFGRLAGGTLLHPRPRACCWASLYDLGSSASAR